MGWLDFCSDKETEMCLETGVWCCSSMLVLDFYRKRRRKWWGEGAPEGSSREKGREEVRSPRPVPGGACMYFFSL